MFWDLEMVFEPRMFLEIQSLLNMHVPWEIKMWLCSQMSLRCSYELQLLLLQRKFWEYSFAFKNPTVFIQNTGRIIYHLSSTCFKLLNLEILQDFEDIH